VSAKGTTAETPSAQIRLCLWLIYYFTLSDTGLKFFPLNVALPLRYLPEAVLYFFVFVLLIKKWRIASFPLFWPLCACALTMTISGILNSSSMLGVIADFRIFFRFAAFTYIGWRTTVTPQRIIQFIKGFLGLTMIELAVGVLEIIGGSGTRAFFSPALGWSSGTPLVVDQSTPDSGSWLFGTLSDYNQFGMFMTMSCLLALALYFMEGAARHLWLASASALAVVLSFSRHSLLLLALALGSILFLRRRDIALARLIRGFALAFVLLVALTGFNRGFDAAFEDRVATMTSLDQLESDRPENMRLLMTMELTPRFLSAYPLFGQGPIAPSDTVGFGETDTALGPPLKAAPDLPPQATFYLGDVVWVMVLGLYGCLGLAAFAYVFWSIAAAANKVRKKESTPAGVILAQACLVTIILFVVSGFFSEEMIARDSIPVFWTLAGMVFSLAIKSSSNNHEVRDQAIIATGIIP